MAAHTKTPFLCGLPRPAAGPRGVSFVADECLGHRPQPLGLDKAGGLRGQLLPLLRLRNSSRTRLLEFAIDDAGGIVGIGNRNKNGIWCCFAFVASLQTIHLANNPHTLQVLQGSAYVSGAF